MGYNVPPVRIEVPELALVTLVGASGSGKSSFARKHFLPTEIVSSDACRGVVSDDENSQDATNDAFDLVHYVIGKRLKRGRLTVVDATNVQEEGRRELLRLAKQYHAVAVAIVFAIDPDIAVERNKQRPDRDFGAHVIYRQTREMRRSLRDLNRQFRYVHVLRSPEEIDAIEIVRTPLWTDRRSEQGPFDIIGDVHGCFEELSDLLANLGYGVERLAEPADGRWFNVTPPEGRRAIFLGDLVDRGPDSPSVLKLAMSMVKDGVAMCVPGNHDAKLLRKLKGKNVNLAHGLQETLDQMAAEPQAFHDQVAKFIDGLVSHFLLDDGKLVVAHAGMKEEMAGRASGAVREFAMYGETTGETDEFGLPIRYNWAADYRGRAMVVYGHTPVPEAEWLNGTICIDTGCVFGGRLSALRYPERELVQVPAKKVYAEAARPFLVQGESRSQQHLQDDLLDLEDIVGKRIVETALMGRVTIREENAISALEVISRFATNPKWLVYLPPTMSPTETTSREDLLEYPTEGFDYFRNAGALTVVCEEKHMGSRSVVVLCRSEEAAQKRFGVENEGIGTVYTRTGRRFFDDSALEHGLLDRLNRAMEASGLWEELASDWVVLDCELMPWSAKAQGLLQQQYGPVGAAANASTQAALEALQGLRRRAPEDEAALGLFSRFEAKAEMASKFVDSYRRYCWTVQRLEDLKLAPFHILAAEGNVFSDRDHIWHMDTLARLAAADPDVLVATPYQTVHLEDPESVERGTQWWEELTSTGGEGMVIKPIDFSMRGPNGLVQPAVKCRGAEYLRIIYGPEYTAPENLSRLRKRGIGRKRALALREFALGLEGLDRFVKQEPLRRVHECAFGVLALESEPIDPRL